MKLETLGWNSFFAEPFAHQFADTAYTVGRVALEHKHIYRVYSEHGELLAEIAGKMRHNALGREDYPAVGDWVVVSARPEEGKATVHAILPRKSKFSRKVAGTVTEEQIVATNVDTVFLVNALNRDFNVRKIERYLLMAWESGANPVIILSKADLCDDVEEKVRAVESVAIGVPIHVVSSLDNIGVDELRPYLGEGRTIALLGSSGVGKSTLINRLHGHEVMDTGSIREDDDRGRHTTTHRELILLPEGGILIDTPGMRELQLWETGDSFEESFKDIEELAESCYYRDCTHAKEPDCAVRGALADGTLDHGRWNNYVKLQKEAAYLARKEDQRLQLAEKEKWKKISQSQRKMKHRK